MKSKKTTLSDIAKKANLSTAAVSMIISNKNLSRFSEETIETVNTIANDLGYHRKTKKDKSLLIICPSIYNPYYATLVQGIEMQASKLNYKTIIRNTYWNIETEKSIIMYARETKVSAIIYTMIPQIPQQVINLCKNIPMIAIGDYNNNYQFDTIDLNNFESGKKVANHLINLGHTKIAYITTALNQYHSARVRRKDGLIEALKENDIKDELIICTLDIPSDTELNIPDIEYETGYKLATKCIKDYPEVTALVGINDMIAFGIMDAVKDLGFSIPKDYSVCGFDNIFPSKFRQIGLTSIENYIVQRGKRAVNLLENKLNIDEIHGEDIQHFTRIEYASKLIIRNSTDIPRKIKYNQL